MTTSTTAYVTAGPDGLRLDGKPYYIVGTNFWHGMNLSAVTEWGGDRARLDDELAELKVAGINCLRIMAGSEGPSEEPYRMKPPMMEKPREYNEEVLVGLDYFMEGIRKNGMTAIVTMTNFWHWSGGLSQYVSWATGENPPYPPSYDEPGQKEPAACGTWETYPKWTERFYTNDVNGLVYKEDPTILAWEICNEPQIPPFEWINSIAGFMKSQNPKQLVTSGIEGKHGKADFDACHSSKHIDFTTCHCWVENWEIYDPADPSPKALQDAVDYVTKFINTCSQWSQELGKPLVMEEFGMARDAFMGPRYEYSTPTTHRDEYYKKIFEKVEQLEKEGKMSGEAFWAWGGHGQPRGPLNKFGCRWVGDPPHETPGWYSVSSGDQSTLKVLSEHAQRVNDMRQ